MNKGEHKQADIDTLVDITLVNLLAANNPEAKPTLDRILTEWRTHALPLCSSFAIK